MLTTNNLYHPVWDYTARNRDWVHGIKDYYEIHAVAAINASRLRTSARVDRRLDTVYQTSNTLSRVVFGRFIANTASMPEKHFL